VRRKMPKSKREVSEKTKQRKMDVRERKIKKMHALHPLRFSIRYFTNKMLHRQRDTHKRNFVFLARFLVQLQGVKQFLDIMECAAGHV